MPLASYVPALDVYQFGKETTRGTAVAATERMAIRRLNVDEAGTRYRPDLAKGILQANRGNELVVARQTTFEIPETPFIYEQMMRFLGMALKGGVAPTGAGPYVWTYARPLAADPTLDSYTIERRRSDGTNNEDIEIPYSMLSQIRFVFGQNEPLRWSATGFGRKVNDAAITAALTMPTPEIPPSALVEVFMDDEYADLGTTKLTLQVIGGEITFETGAMPYMTADGRADLDFTLAIINPDAITGTANIQCLVNHTRLANERAAARDQALRALRLRVAGTGGREFELDFLGTYAKTDILANEESDGQWTASFNLELSTDGSNPSISAMVTNSVAA